MPITYKKKKKQVTVAADEHFRKDLKIEELQSLPGAFIPKGGTVTAGNSSGINDGASAILLMSRQKANELGVKPLATVTGKDVVGCGSVCLFLQTVPSHSSTHQTLFLELSHHMSRHSAANKPLETFAEGVRPLGCPAAGGSMV